MTPPSQRDRREATRAALVGAGRRLFGERGFAAVPADEVVTAAGVTRGALSYHFEDKRGLFRAVFEELEHEIADNLATLVLQDSDEPVLARALTAFLDICDRPEVVRIALTDAPSVLGWETWREIESQHGLGLLTALLADAPGNGTSASPQVTAQLVLGAVIEGALYVAAAEDRKQAREHVEASLLRVFAALLP